MAYAIICDKCKKVCVSDEDKELLVCLKVYKNCSGCGEYHLCPTCYSKFNSFISGIGQKNEQPSLCSTCKHYEGENFESLFCKECKNNKNCRSGIVYDHYEEED